MDYRLLSLLVLVVLAVTYSVLEYVLGIKLEAKEPPIVPSKVPWFGHLLGIIAQRSRYMVTIRKKTRSPICTLPMPGGKMYVVNTPGLIGAVQRNAKTLQFAPFASKSHRSVFGTSAEAEKIVMNNIDLKDGHWGLWYEALGAVHQALGPGQALEQMSHVMLANLSTSFNTLTNKSATRATTINLLGWLRHQLTIATTEAMYGPSNPFRDIHTETALWDYENNIMMVMANVFPQITAKKAYQGREAVVRALRSYFENNSHEQGSHLVKVMRESTQKYGLAVDDHARFELSNAVAVLVNTLPTAFWMLYHIFGDLQLLSELRAEVDVANISSDHKESQERVRTIDVEALKDNCPLLNSVWLETLRTRANGSSTREVMDDTTLDGQYLLKKGSVIQMPSLVIHNDQEVWGASAASFDPRRHLPKMAIEAGADKKSKERQHPSAFRAFGGGTTWCPGRHFAKNEILALVASMISRFDVAPTGAAELPWPDLGIEDSDMAAAIMYPGKDMLVDIIARKDSLACRWEFKANGEVIQ
ncbi:Cytochrome P450-like protein 37 [Elsinoe fawcettii]|nr:Cytochrome P450-like protein 37 [Elsinoe fawcettii]